MTTTRGGVLLSILAGAITACGTNDSASATSSNASLGYAEQVYGSVATASHGTVSISVSTQSSGSMAELAGKRFEDVLKTPSVVLTTRMVATDIVSAAFTPRGPANDDFFAGRQISGFENNGHLLSEGIYRVLDVRMSVGTQEADYLALEATWPDFSIVVDPVLEQADSIADAHSSFSHEAATTRRGVSSALTSDPTDPGILNDPTSGSPATDGEPVTDTSQLGALPTSERPASDGSATESSVVYCSLASHPRDGSLSLTWSGYTAHVNDVFGIHLVNFYMGSQQTGIRCYVNGSGTCLPEAFGYSNDSSCNGNLGWSCACKNTGITAGRTSHQEKVAAQTRCTANNPLKANASVSYEKNGVGASFTIAWDSHGASDDVNNGGSELDTCNWHQ
jgi:hypothetical protein